MHPGTIASLFLILFGLMEFFLRRGATAKSVKAGSSDRGTTFLIFASYVFAILALSLDLPGSTWFPELRWIGVGSATFGTMLRIWSMHILGRYYTRTLVTTSDQRVVQRGPYRFVRHPGYLAALLIWVGAAIASGSVTATVLVFALLIIAYGYRIRNEERMLVEALGAEYSDYQRKTSRLVPFIY
jgi:protein-S-isoprenylcysteine O-methyltransferase Ste14